MHKQQTSGDAAVKFMHQLVVPLWILTAFAQVQLIVLSVKKKNTFTPKKPERSYQVLGTFPAPKTAQVRHNILRNPCCRTDIMSADVLTQNSRKGSLFLTFSSVIISLITARSMKIVLKA